MDLFNDIDDTAALLAALPARISAIPRHWAARTPHAPALRDGARQLSYAALAGAVDAAAARLRALGLRPGDRLLVVGENCLEQVVLCFAAASIDAWIVLVNSRLSAPELDQILAHSGARRVLYTAAEAAEAAAHGRRHGALPARSLGGGDGHAAGLGPNGDGGQAAAAAPDRRNACGAAGAAFDALERCLVGPLDEGCAAAPVQAGGAGQAAALVYTSGTTGQPKGVMLSHRNLLYIAAVSSTLRGLRPQDRAYGVLPISHVYGLASVMLGTLYAGACLQLAARFSPQALLAAVRDDGLTIVQGVPAMYARLLAALGGAAGPAGAPLPSRLRFIYAGGSPLTPSLKADVERLFGLPLHNGYGMTESAPTISQTSLAAPRADTSVGLEIPGVQTRVVDADGADAAPGAVGELWVRGPNVMLGYYREAAMTAQVLRPGGWLDTGDLARRDADGALFIAGRSKELIIRSGFNVYPLEVETVLNAHPAVTQSAVVGRDAADGDEEVVAFVEIDPHHAVADDVANGAADGAAESAADGAPHGALRRALHAHLAGALAPYKLPAQIVVMTALPAAASGKVLKGRLRELAQGLPRAGD
ncbi:class I adenylate-forming enzyme family protein [Rugamonas sp. CCM 8940]|uniref:class I adenylate-forming enzyme family protein n=1 Tax=Rugamonas sp. CCM 8940 TaxID=2765359 RepID=UPI0018F39F75|nr:class I adenylate-forming enzyme family protein [Rugamonas sp. CCM 8940]MBJ7312649.1 acyl--CoA ligase [Rugamonas sp. CCM 8940]